jgi:hypothetical protein
MVEQIEDAAPSTHSDGNSDRQLTWGPCVCYDGLSVSQLRELDALNQKHTETYKNNI